MSSLTTEVMSSPSENGLNRVASSTEEMNAEKDVPPQVKTQPDDVTSHRSLEFFHRFFPKTGISQWNDWKWQLQNSFTTIEVVSKVMKLSEEEIAAISKLKENHRLPFRVSPYYLAQFYDSEPGSPLRRTMIPTLEELIETDSESSDPLNEMGTCPVPGIIHRYPDRALFTVTQCCSAYCRYCTRSRFVGKLGTLTRNQWDRAIEYLRQHKEIRDVVISGGDPLTMPDDKIEYILSQLRAIKHIEILRIGTKVPVVLPMRITPQLTAMLHKYHPLFISIHFTHPSELTPETQRACEMLANAGMPMGSQTVLLKGINNDPLVMKRLMQKLLMARVRPYYIYQCDPVSGSSHFRTKIEDGIAVIENLRGFTSGYAVPQFVIDAPGGGGKIPILPDYVVESGPDKWVLRNYKKKIYQYSNKE